MKYTITQTRTFKTTIVVEANSLNEAEERYLQLLDSGYTFELELQQNDVEDLRFDITETK